VSARLTLICAAPTAGTALAAFPFDEELDVRGAAWAAAARGTVERVTHAVCSPALSCRQTAAALGLARQLDPRIRDWDLGRWRGHTLDEIADVEPDAVQAWLVDPGAAPHGGEALSGLLARVDDWLNDARLGALPVSGHTAAITHSAVIRAAVVGTLSAAAQGFWRIDIAPMTVTVLRGGPGRWTVRTTGRPLVPRQHPDHCGRDS
jgi:broad specificity phosphatase PhoE